MFQLTCILHYLSTLGAKECLEKFGIGSIVQIDDFPYVYMMRRISDELRARGYEGAFFLTPALPFRDPREWGTLTHLINEDYQDIVKQTKPDPANAALWVFDRIDNARVKVGCEAILKKLPQALRNEIAQVVEADAAKLLKDKLEEIDKAKDLSDKTIVIEFSRGGADSSPMPLPAPYGYKYSLSQLSQAILEKTAILYLWVSPEESRRKNEARANPKDPGSILNHAVPRAVMYTEYGCDDIDWLLKNSNKPNTVSISAHGNVYNLPLGRFDNRIDRTSFARSDVNMWNKDDVQKLHAALTDAFWCLTNFARN